ncbi:hypothetical protein HN670_04120 [bacterium]|jgi:hypothetical protein|nr:hypothetical protein [bacterium]
MPNIHLYVDQMTYHKLLPIIEAVMLNLGLQDDAVATWHGAISVPVSCDGNRTPMPYVEVTSTNPEEVERIIAELNDAKVKIDVEIPPTLLRFIPAEEMKPK